MKPATNADGVAFHKTKDGLKGIGQEIRVWSYSNCEEVELIVNGRSQGRKEMPRNSHLEWKVKYEPGYIELRGYNAGQLVATDRKETTGKAVAIRLKPDREKIKADNHDVSQVTVEIIDKKGRMVPTANNEITFTISDNGKIIGACNGDPACHVPENRTIYPAFNGLMMVYVQSSFEAGPITLKAKAPGLETAEVVIKAEACTPKPFVPSLTK
ncbi:Beta-galactosidase BoGH2A [subsurface metagenome]